MGAKQVVSGFIHVTVALIYETNVRQKTGRTVIPMQSSAFINLDVSVGYDQI